MNGRFQIAIHILTLLCRADDELLSSDYIAGSININPALVRKEISNLRNHQLIISKEGKNGGYSLGKPASQIRLSAIFKAVKQGAVLGQAKNLPNPECPVGRQINTHLNNLQAEMEAALVTKLGSMTLAGFSKQFD
ncbi:Rrf2 family transcriptional regulator [Mucilaginibacter sp.]|uniref:Rrf2 family transcriptional regulator n=1 Tax=Mucilaginibacter sp. TaxID=1882438 RepID=UPI003D144B2F